MGLNLNNQGNVSNATNRALDARLCSSLAGEQRGPERESLHISISRQCPDGSEEILEASEPCRGGNHIRIIFQSFHELFAQGYEPKELAGVFVRTFTNGQQETCWQYTQADIELAFEQYQRTLVT
jgi:hypothetical protein